jgi:hypothetical protein
MRASVRSLPILALLAATCVPAEAIRPVPYPTAPSYSVLYGCDVKHVPQTPGNHKITPDAYAVVVSANLTRALVAGTSILYDVRFSDGTIQNATIALPYTIPTGSSGAIANFSSAIVPESCSAGTPTPSTPPHYGYGGNPFPISSSPKPVLHQI